MPGAEGYFHLLLDWNHWAFEITGEIVTVIIVSPLIAKLVRIHDRRKHNADG